MRSASSPFRHRGWRDTGPANRHRDGGAGPHSVRGPGTVALCPQASKGSIRPFFLATTGHFGQEVEIADCPSGLPSSSVSNRRGVRSRAGPRAWNVRATHPGEAITSARRRGNSEAHLSAKRPQTSEATRLPAPHVHSGGTSHPQGAPPQGPPPPVGLTPHRSLVLCHLPPLGGLTPSVPSAIDGHLARSATRALAVAQARSPRPFARARRP